MLSNFIPQTVLSLPFDRRRKKKIHEHPHFLHVPEPINPCVVYHVLITNINDLQRKEFKNVSGCPIRSQLCQGLWNIPSHQ